MADATGMARAGAVLAGMVVGAVLGTADGAGAVLAGMVAGVVLGTVDGAGVALAGMVVPAGRSA